MLNFSSSRTNHNDLCPASRQTSPASRQSSRSMQLSTTRPFQKCDMLVFGNPQTVVTLYSTLPHAARNASSRFQSVGKLAALSLEKCETASEVDKIQILAFLFTDHQFPFLSGMSFFLQQANKTWCDVKQISHLLLYMYQALFLGTAEGFLAAAFHSSHVTSTTSNIHYSCLSSHQSQTWGRLESPNIYMKR